MLDEVLVGDLGEPPTLVGIKVDVVDEQRSGTKRAGGNGGLAGGDGTGVIHGTSEVAVRHLAELKVDLDLVVLYVLLAFFQRQTDYVLEGCYPPITV